MEAQGNGDHDVGLQELQSLELMDYQPTCDREQHLAREPFTYKEDINEVVFVVGALEKINAHELLTFNDTVASEVTS